ncbi:DNA-binding XRE family transcriptional regulator [Nitrobacteraceae bacterium AZCC 2161]
MKTNSRQSSADLNPHQGFSDTKSSVLLLKQLDCGEFASAAMVNLVLMLPQNFNGCHKELDLWLTAFMANNPDIAPPQLRAARAWLGWSQNKLALRSGVSKQSIARYEQGRSIAYDGTLAKLKGTLEAAGIRFHFDGATKGISANTITDAALDLDN